MKDTNLIWKTAKRKVSDLKPAEYNPRQATEKQCTDLKNSLTKFSIADPIIINTNNTIIGGHFRIRELQKLGVKEVDVRIPNRKLTDDEERELNIRLNKNLGEWNYDLLANFDETLLSEVGFGIKELEDIFNIDSENLGNSGKLFDNFIIPPFSIFDTRQGYWQERKQKWFDLNLFSDNSRKNIKSSGSLSGSIPNFYSIKNRYEKLFGRKISNKEFIDKYGKRLKMDSNLKYTNTGGLLSIFDPVVSEIIYRWFCVHGGNILDPFAGGGSRGIVAGYLGYNYFGIDLNKNQIKENQQLCKKIFNKKDETKFVPNYYIGDSRELEKIIPTNKKFDIIFSCPPYFDMEIYSNDKNDISNMNYTEFLRIYGEIIKKSVSLLKNNGTRKKR